MCTATWILGDEPELFFNRDERRSRDRGEPPSVWERDGIRFLSPRDPAAGGSWIFSNEFGLTAAILNRYDTTGWTPPLASILRSRGLLVVDAASSPNLDTLTDAVARAVRREAYAPFFLLALEPGRPPRIVGWDGAKVDGGLAGTALPDPVGPGAGSAASIEPPFTTAGPESVRLGAIRSAAFERMRTAAGGVSADLLERFHRGEDSDDPTVSVCMDRPEAWTVSRTRVHVGREETRMWYWPRGAEGTFGRAIESVLPRRSRAHG